MAGSPRKRAKRAKAEKTKRAEERIAALPRNRSLATIPKPEEPKDRWGRPSKFRPEYVEHTRILCEEGHTDREIAEFFGITRKTLHNWRRDHPELAAVMGIGKQLANDRVNRTAFELAVGYTTTVTEIFKMKNAQGGEIIATHEREVNVAPDRDMVKWWQKNREPQNWKDKTEQERTLEVKHVLPIDEVRERVKARLAEIKRIQSGIDQG